MTVILFMRLGTTQQPGGSWRDAVRQARALLSSRLCVRIAVMVFFGILAVEAAILIPSYYRYKQDLLVRLEDSGHTAVIAGLQKHAHDDIRDLLNAGRYLARGPRLRGGAIYSPDGEFIGSFGETPELSVAAIRATEVRRQLSPERQVVRCALGTSGRTPAIPRGRSHGREVDCR